jgi:hypothetical protein
MATKVDWSEIRAALKRHNSMRISTVWCSSGYMGRRDVVLHAEEEWGSNGSSQQQQRRE